MPYTLKDIADFCYSNRRKKGFKGFTYQEVCEVVVWAADNEKLAYIHDDKDILGVCIYSIVVKTIYIHHIVCIRNGFKLLINHAKNLYPGFAISGLRNGKVVTFNKSYLWAILHKA